MESRVSKRCMVASLSVLSLLVCGWLQISGKSIMLSFDVRKVRNESVNSNRSKGLELNSSRSKGCFDSPFVICPKDNNASPDTSPVSTMHQTKTNEQIKPLIFTSLIDSGDELDIFKNFNFSLCRYPCVLKSRDSLNENEAKGIIVDGRWVKDQHFPAKRYNWQIYMMFVLESPVHYRGSILHARSKFKDQIDVVSTYRVDSDIRYFYGKLTPNGNPKTQIELAKIYQGKSRMAAWFVSNCNAPSKRREYVQQLQEHIDVDIYGKCGNNSYQKFGSEQRLLTTTYKFYLSFENSLCKDYVTEKFFKLFDPDVHIIPVVRGGTDYKKYFPPSTFINTADFGSPARLARYLKDVAGNQDLYLQFLENIDAYTPVKHDYLNKERICQACAVLHNKGKNMTSRHSDIREWSTKNICYMPDDLRGVRFQNLLRHRKKYFFN